jgi:crotonobetainyl-CoA:carnitine CoA-transferase CaiB-like acyl-CoA transferase
MLVTDLSRDVAGRFCTRLLALGGADVVSYPGPRPDVRGLQPVDWLSTYLDPHKWMAVHGMAGATSGTAGAGNGAAAATDYSTLEEMVRASDVVVTSFDRGGYLGPLDADGVRDLNADVVHVTTSSYGTTGPIASWRGGSLAEWAAGGYLYITGDPSGEPLCGPEHLCGYVGGYTAAIAVQAGSILRQRTGRGSHIDVSVMAAMLSMHQSTFSRLGVGIVRMRTGRYTEVYPLTVLPCRDGFVSLGSALDEEFDRLVLAVGMPEILGDPRFANPAARAAHRDDLDALLVPWLAERDAAQVVEIVQDAGLPCAKVATTTEVLANPQLEARDYWEDVTVDGVRGRVPGSPVLPATVPESLPLSTTPSASTSPQSSTPAAPVGESITLTPEGVRSIIAARGRTPDAGRTGASTSRLPLGGDPPVLVLDLTAFWAGPSATRNLADLGARVIRVERPRSRVDFADTSDEGALIGYLFDYKMNRDKESVVIDLRTEDGKQVFRSLAARADVVVENYRAGVMDRLGLGYESLSANHPELVYVSLSGFGATGPWSPWRSYGPTIEAASSIEARTGYVDGKPLRLGHTLPDGVGGLVGTLAALDGLRRRDLTGKGGRYDLSQLEAYCALSGEELLASSVRGDDQPRRGNQGNGVSPHGVYPCCGDDQWIALAVANDDEWAAFVSVVAADGLTDERYRIAAGRLSNRDELDRSIARWTSSVDKVTLAAALQAKGIEAFPVATPPDLVADPQLHARGYFVEVSLRGEPVKLPGSPLSASPSIVRTDGRPPAFGEHTASVLMELAGCTEDEVARLGREGVVVLGADPVPL